MDRFAGTHRVIADSAGLGHPDDRIAQGRPSAPVPRRHISGVLSSIDSVRAVLLQI